MTQAADLAGSNALKEAINHLLGKYLFVLLRDDKNNMSYRAVSKEEAKIKSELSGDEQILYTAISAGGTKGVWKRTLVTHTKLVPTIFDRTVKKLESKNLIKLVKNVEHPTRRMYMLYHLEPSVELTGGPWYTENELDTAFIDAYAQATIKYIREQSWPKSSKHGINAVYSTTNNQRYPSARQITDWLKKSNLSATILAEEHVRVLLDMLVYSGEIEALPSMRSHASFADSTDSESNNSESETLHSGSEDEGSRKGKSKKRGSRSHRKSTSGRNKDSNSSRGKKRKRDSPSDSEDDSQEEAGSSDAESDSDQNRSVGSKRGRQMDDSDPSDSESSDEEHSRKKKRGRSSSSKRSGRSRSAKREESPTDMDMSFADFGVPVHSILATNGSGLGGNGSGLSNGRPRNITLSGSSADHVVYRAIRRGAPPVVAGWSQSPCGICPRFDFCDDSGPINPISCEYYGEWLEPPVEEPAIEGDGADGGADEDEEILDDGGPQTHMEIDEEA
ncbi:hypothetical protein DL93DRAFT_2069843 [Clavulina sp. PMI_390]|nr:hypothetical protein DL93DRAFT_2069843 [Clavulina sp. PMI_390]